ncbi:DEAD/DEAH box helicase [Quisquiliibacterium transsilvanicum]|uniref:Superfamily II DNA/RNA helicase n=1 Tax=Quisquiliibacterium transsilvanicum TaxID=1549638 RepID=A0A7W8HG59_9BURK|nr:DEAD/DEAH box helicase [Quisquiliibacterium transsilvanicum]MBB5270861.1 superfamily II DNA/RNA helicase [Quisquiliibacterium transsilvanicum]
MSQATFAELGLAAPIVDALTAAGYEHPTSVQAQSIPSALEGQDLLVSSQTGSGKTAAFVLPGLQKLLTESKISGRGPRMLVLTPTRELALQVNKAAMTYGRGLRNLRTLCVVGGSPYAQQLRMLERPVDIVVATPGRLLDHLQSGRIDFGRLEMLVLDEADRMLDMGFVEDIESIVARTPETRQTVLFSATLDGVVGQLARRLTRNAKRIDVAAPARESLIEQRLMFADDLGHKNRLLDALLRETGLNQAVVFASTRRSTEDIAQLLADSGFAVSALHGEMHQGQRNRTLQGLRDGRTQVLVATDVAARGIDVAGISHVINFDSPRNAEDYVHRIGRTGRAGRTGVAVTLFNHSEAHRVRDIERYTGKPIEVSTIPGLEPVRRASSSKPRFGQGRPGGGNGPRRGAPSSGFGANRPFGGGDRGGFGGGDNRGFGGGDRGGFGGGDRPHAGGADNRGFGGENRGNRGNDRGGFGGNDRGFGGGDRGGFGGRGRPGSGARQGRG